MFLFYIRGRRYDDPKDNRMKDIKRGPLLICRVLKDDETVECVDIFVFVHTYVYLKDRLI